MFINFNLEFNKTTVYILSFKQSLSIFNQHKSIVDSVNLVISYLIDNL